MDKKELAQQTEVVFWTVVKNIVKLIFYILLIAFCIPLLVLLFSALR